MRVKIIMRKIVFEVVLIGDTGAPNVITQDPVFALLRKELPAHKDSAVFFLGDNIYPKGMPAPGAIGRNKAERRLKVQLDALEGFKGRICFIPGNHDWLKGKKGGAEANDRQQEYIEDLLGEGSFLPRNGCPGPSLVLERENLVVFALNTQWWISSGFKPIGQEHNCVASDKADFFKKLEAALDAYPQRQKMVIGHHPLYTDAVHGGKFLPRHHLFPLTLYHPDAWIPLPLFGSLFVAYRKFIGAREDVAHPKYRKLRRKLIKLFAKFPDLIYASGHEHNIQYIHRNKNHFIVSGAGSKLSYVRPGKYSIFAHPYKGFFKLKFFDTGQIQMEVFEVPHFIGEGRLSVSRQLNLLNPVARSAQSEQAALDATLSG